MMRHLLQPVALARENSMTKEGKGKDKCGLGLCSDRRGSGARGDHLVDFPKKPREKGGHFCPPSLIKLQPGPISGSSLPYLY